MAFRARKGFGTFEKRAPVPQLSMVVSETMDLLYARFGNLFSCLNQPWLSQANLVDFSQSIYRKGAALDNCWGFIDGTVRPVARPGEHQRVLFNGHKRVHAIKFQSVVAPNGLIVDLVPWAKCTLFVLC